MAQDRLWQMEMWRRQPEGRMAEILGPQAVARDHVARMLKYRGPWTTSRMDELPPGRQADLRRVRRRGKCVHHQHAKNLPVEFKLTGIMPEPWTPETLLLRAGTFGDASAELTLARNVVRLGAEAANKQRAPDPWDDLKCRRVWTCRSSTRPSRRPAAEAAVGRWTATTGPPSSSRTAAGSAARGVDPRSPGRRSGIPARTTGSSAAGSPPQASRWSPTIRIARSRIRPCATSCISSRRAGT